MLDALKTLIGLQSQDKAGEKNRMRFFKHGEVLAISLPESLRQKLGVSENDEYDFLEIRDGGLALVKKGAKTSLEKIRQTLPLLQTTNASAKPAATYPKPENSKPALSTTAKPASLPSPEALQNKPASFSSTGAALDRQGFLVLSTEDEAKAFSQRFENQIKAGEIKGVRGFDKKFYLASRAFSEAYADRLLVALKEPKTAPELATTLRQPLDGVTALLYLLKEEGEIIEKKRGLFARVL